MATWRDVRRIAAKLPEAQEDTVYRERAFRVRKKLFAWMSPHEDGALVVKVDPDERPLLIESRPNVYFVTPHYQGHPMLLVRLRAAGANELSDLIEDSWLRAAPQRLADAYATDG
jgi:hypothetical protein